jgi:thioredoxin reductase
MTHTLPIAVLGAGPVGLAAAAHLVARGLEPLVLEASDDVAASVRDWAHVRLFSPWRYGIDKAAARLLEETGWTAPPAEGLPTGGELHHQYLKPLAEHPRLRTRLRLGHRVVAVTRLGLDKVRTAGRGDVPFSIRTIDAAGVEHEHVARAVIDATGTWQSPNPLGADGLPARGESALGSRIHHGIPDVLGRHRDRYLGKSTLVVGAGHSAANTLLALAQLAGQAPSTKIVWATRGGDLSRVFGGGEADGLPARGKLGTDLRALIDEGRLVSVRSFRIDAVRSENGKLVVSGLRAGEPLSLADIDSIVVATGQRPDLSITRELRLAIDPALESVAVLGPLIDPNEHSCGTVRPHGAKELAHPEPGFYVIGSKSYGRAPTFLLATGYEQARSVVAMLAGDVEAAMRVELDLPETGVCVTDRADESSSCCGPPAGTARKKGACC